jgi:hypothetical protein
VPIEVAAEEGGAATSKETPTMAAESLAVMAPIIADNGTNHWLQWRQSFDVMAPE